MRRQPTLGREEQEIIELYNVVTSDFVRHVPGAFDLALSAFRPELDDLEARRLIVGLSFIHNEFMSYQRLEQGDGNTDNTQRQG